MPPRLTPPSPRPPGIRPCSTVKRHCRGRWRCLPGWRQFYNRGKVHEQAGGALSSSVGSTCDSGLPSVTGGSVEAVAPDGSGGWYIGGSFDTVGGLTRDRLAHILANKTVDTSWNPGDGTISTINAIAVSSDGTPFIPGGNFNSTIGGQWRSYIAAICADKLRRRGSLLPVAPPPGTPDQVI